jgi:hypothetical protein
MTCDDTDLEIVFKTTAKTVPNRLLTYYVEHPEEAREKLEVLCRKHQTVKSLNLESFRGRINDLRT